MSARFVTGVSCTVSAVSDSGICPFCKMALKDADQAEFQQKLEAFENGEYSFSDYNNKEPEPAGWTPKPHPGYVAMWNWARSQDRCFRHVAHMRNSYKKHTGTDVDLNL